MFELILAATFCAEPTLPAPFTAERFKAHVAYLASDELEGRNVDSPGGVKAAEYMAAQLKADGVSPLAKGGDWIQKFDQKWEVQKKTQTLTCRNVLGVVAGAGTLADQAVLVSTHHDHVGVDPKLVEQKKDGVFNGADDNASGCAAMLLMAEALNHDVKSLPANRRTVVFASFDAEERGLLGSRHYVLHPLWPLEKTTANINFDMVGRLRGGRLFAYDSRSNAFLADQVATLCSEAGLRGETRMGGTYRADHASFLEREIPALHFCTGLHSDYHQVTDETSKVNHEGGARIAWVAYQLLRKTMERPGRLPFQKAPPVVDVQAAIALVVKLGMYPEQNAQGGKYPVVKFVFPGGVAAKCGVQAGDQVAAINGQEFERIEDAAALFTQVKFDQPLKLRVLRKEKSVEIVVPVEMMKELVKSKEGQKNGG